MLKNCPFATKLASLQNGALEFIKISFFMPFTTLLDSVDKEEPRTISSRSIGSSLRDSGWTWLGAPAPVDYPRGDIW